MNKAISKTLKELRKKYHVSQEQLAEAIDSHQVYISEIEQGKKIPSIVILKNIARYYKMTLTELVSIIEKNDMEDING